MDDAAAVLMVSLGAGTHRLIQENADEIASRRRDDSWPAPREGSIRVHTQSFDGGLALGVNISVSQSFHSK